ncbi:hypothetical protein [Terracoccus sp. 273MFTsu3.1]|uniref:hypothetical protein n=1 Tax=Terracoccus sp. 273MFTsu3.1 TaxID=1172188 RepID=UPI0003641885|nr:hypothetical protein [Terracoccus sp. 273MFTsu3.1]
MPFTHRPEESTEDRNTRLANTTDAFILWASEFGLIDTVVDETGQIAFLPAACGHEEVDEEDEVHFAHYAPRHAAPRRTTQRLRRAALPVAASMLVGSAAYAAQQMTSNRSGAVAPAASGHLSASAAKRTAEAITSTPTLRQAEERKPSVSAGIEAITTPLWVLVSLPASGEKPKASHHTEKMSSLTYKAVKNISKPAKTLPAQAAQQAVAKVTSLPKKITKSVTKVITNPPVTLPSVPVVPIPEVSLPPVDVPVPAVPVPEVTTPVVDPVVDTVTAVVSSS